MDDTIVAVSSAPGRGALGIVRVSGPHAIAVADAVARLPSAAGLCDAGASHRHEGETELEHDLRLPAYFYLFRAPRSYTRQDMVEVHTVGSPPVLEMLREKFISLGARPAEPGEFTARAFLNGAIDLASAEAVAGIIRARSDSQLRAARHVMDGALAGEVMRIRDELAALLALVEADIDFAEEPIEFITPPALVERLNSLLVGLSTMMNAASQHESVDRLPHILLLGPPNAGKSSLMNRLSGTNRAICAAVAGTTRDILSAVIRIGRGEALLLDAAGVDPSPDAILRRARALTLERAQQVDIVCLVLDANEMTHTPMHLEAFLEHLGPIATIGPASTIESVPWTESDSTLRPGSTTPLPSRERGRGEGQVHGPLSGLNPTPCVAACNKCDLLDEAEIKMACDVVKRATGVEVHAVSAANGCGLEELRASFAAILGDVDQSVAADAVVLNRRQSAAVSDAAAALKRASELCATATEIIECADLVAFELREALECLGLVTGQITTEDLLHRVFADFCIGK